jgi:hypothetical protein
MSQYSGSPPSQSGALVLIGIITLPFLLIKIGHMGFLDGLRAPVINDVSTDLENPPAFTASKHPLTLSGVKNRYLNVSMVLYQAAQSFFVISLTSTA